MTEFKNTTAWQVAVFLFHKKLCPHYLFLLHPTVALTTLALDIEEPFSSRENECLAELKGLGHLALGAVFIILFARHHMYTSSFSFGFVAQVAESVLC